MKKSLILIPLMAALLCGCNGGGEKGSDTGSGSGSTPAGSGVTYDFSSLTEKGTAFTADTALAAFTSCASGDNIVTAATATYVYSGAAEGGVHGNKAGLVKFGKSAASGELVLTLSKSVSKVTINCHDFYALSDSYPTNSNSFVVNGDSKLMPYNAEGTPSDLVFNLSSAVTTLTIASAYSDTSKGGRGFIFSITLA